MFRNRDRAQVLDQRVGHAGGVCKRRLVRGDNFIVPGGDVRVNHSRGSVATGIEFLHKIGIANHVVAAGAEGIDQGFGGLEEAGDFSEEDDSAEKGAVGDCADADHSVVRIRGK